MSTKKSVLSKTSISIIALSLLLVVSIALTATLAYFWDARRSTTQITFSSGIVLDVAGISNGGTSIADRKTTAGVWGSKLTNGTTNDSDFVTLTRTMDDVDNQTVFLAPLGVQLDKGASGDAGNATVTVRVGFTILITFESAAAATSATTGLATRITGQANTAAGAWVVDSATATEGAQITSIAPTTSQLLVSGFYTRVFTKTEMDANTVVNVFAATGLKVFDAYGTDGTDGVDNFDYWTGANIKATVVIKALGTGNITTPGWDAITGYSLVYS